MEQKNIWIYYRAAYPDSMVLVTQKESLTEYARANGMTVCGVTAEAASGTMLSRAGLEEVNKEIASGKIHYLLVKDISRLGREVLQVVSYIEWLKKNGVELICADGFTWDNAVQKVICGLIRAKAACLNSQKKTKKR